MYIYVFTCLNLNLFIFVFPPTAMSRLEKKWGSHFPQRSYGWGDMLMKRSPQITWCSGYSKSLNSSKFSKKRDMDHINIWLPFSKTEICTDSQRYDAQLVKRFQKNLTSCFVMKNACLVGPLLGEMVPIWPILAKWGKARTRIHYNAFFSLLTHLCILIGFSLHSWYANASYQYARGHSYQQASLYCPCFFWGGEHV